ncbi:hypothetical protein [Paraburkholderia phytofirmans]|uniref:Uncharacterized protein n=1 Tax=Paraburkholderia phytofirmans TaxID=261302 RepID=A0ABW9BV13_9BURK
MKAIQKLLDRIEVQRKSIERLESDRAAAEAAIAGASEHIAPVNELKAQRRRLLAEAMIAKKIANTTAIDAQIANAEQLHTAAQTAATTARDALDILDEGVRIAEAGLVDLQGELRTTIGDEILAVHDAALEKYLSAVAMLKEGVTGMVAADRAWKHVARALDHRKFPGRGEKVLMDIRETGLRVPHTASRLADPKVAAEYTPDYPDYWFLPAWADPLTADFANEQTADLVDALAKAGIDCGPLPRPPQPENMVTIRVKKGRIFGSPRITRSAETGEIISQEEVMFGPYEDVLIDEPTARKLRASDMVRIHGEEELPVRPAEIDPNAPVVIDVSPPKDRPSRQQNISVTGDYRGTFHSLDMSGYE